MYQPSIHRFAKFIAIVIVLISVQWAKASHMMGADMQYQYLGKNQYKITAKIYRDCQGVAFTLPTFGCYAGNNGGNGCGSKLLNIVVTNIRDITPRCSTNTLGCSQENKPSAGLGIEEHTYEALVDFSQPPLSDFMNQNTCCDVTFYLGQCCRNGAITTGSAGEDFYTQCMINVSNITLTNKSNNSSPIFTNTPVALLCCNTPWYYNFGAIDTTDYDSIQYSLVAGIRVLPNNGINYSGSFSPKFPMTPYCKSVIDINCTPNPKSYPPVGFYFDTTNGDIVVTPTNCSEVPVIVVELKEFRKSSSENKWLLIGKTRRDIQLRIMDNCSPNKPPIISGQRYIEVIEGDTVRDTIHVTDSKLSPAQVLDDEVLANWDGGIKGASFTVVDPSKREKDYHFFWATKLGDASDVAYNYSVTASDQHCDFPQLNISSFKIKVKPRNNSVSSLRKSEYALYPNPGIHSVTISGADQNVKYEVLDLMGKSVFSGSGPQIDIDRLTSGMYWVRINSMVILRLVKA
jgi:hypothetical protein